MCSTQPSGMGARPCGGLGKAPPLALLRHVYSCRASAKPGMEMEGLLLPPPCFNPFLIRGKRHPLRWRPLTSRLGKLRKQRVHLPSALIAAADWEVAGQHSGYGYWSNRPIRPSYQTPLPCLLPLPLMRLPGVQSASEQEPHLFLPSRIFDLNVLRSNSSRPHRHHPGLSYPALHFCSFKPAYRGPFSSVHCEST